MVLTDKAKIEEVLTRGVENIYPDKNFLYKQLLSGRKLKLYCGYDPSSAHLHIGHMITLNKLAQFQKIGHEVIFLVGDFTGMIGDPTDKSATRKKLSRQEVLKNSQDYKKIAANFLNFSGDNAAKILYNSQWNDKLTFKDVIELASNFTVQQMIVREMFQERLKARKPIYLHEFLYPLSQAYDSVAMGVDLEIGGNDQTFNMLAGRELMKVVSNKEKSVLTLKLLTDSSGKKMGKSEGNMVNLDEDPKQMFGKIMSWSDGLIRPGLELLTNLSIPEIRKISKEMDNGEVNPRDIKALLARSIVSVCCNAKEAEEAENEFNKVFRKKAIPSDIAHIEIKESEMDILDFLVMAKLAASKSQAKRLVVQGGVKINNAPEKDWRKKIAVKKGMLAQAGKRKFARIN